MSTRPDKPHEKRVGGEGPRLVFGVKLGPDEEWVIGNFDRLNQPAVGRDAAKDHPRLLKPRAVPVVEFVTVPMTFMKQPRLFNPRGFLI